MAIPINEDPYYSSSTYAHYDSEPEADQLPLPHFRPPSIETICRQTKFSRKELQIIYRAFKQGCPNGTISLEQFQEIYTQFFPRGGTSKYAEYVFRTFDRDGDNYISFEEFVNGLSVISRGTVAEKLHWIFTLYDIDRRGAIGHSELVRIARSMYELIGSESGRSVPYNYVLDHVRTIVERLDKDKDGLISRDEFVALCEADETICQSLQLFDTHF